MCRFLTLNNKNMNLLEEILALLKAQFSGVREDGLQQLAAALSLQVETKEQATELVGKLTAEKVDTFVKDWRKKADEEIGKANKTYEDGLKKKYDFVEKKATTPPAPPAPKPGEGVTLEQISELIDTKLSGLKAGLDADKAAATRNAQFVAALDKAGIKGATRDLLLDGFQRTTFKDDEDFNAYLTKQEAQFATIAQEQADKGLLGGGKPIFGAVTKEGVSQGVADYIATQASENKPLTGKEV